MQKLISQIPQLSAFLNRVPKANHSSAIKQIIQLGLKAMQSTCSNGSQNNSNSLLLEIDHIKENLQELNHRVKHQCHHHCCNCFYPNTERVLSEQRQPERDYRQQALEEVNSKTFSFKPQPQKNVNKRKFEPPIRESTGKFVDQNELDNKSTINPFSKNKNVVGRHHLDDTQVRQALNFPPSLLVQTSYPLKRKSQDYKKHIYQEEINKEQQIKLKEEIGDDEYEYQRHRPRAVTDYRKAKSKIKNLLDKDRIRFYQKQRDQSFQDGLNKYEYSDQNQMEESSIHQKPQKESSSNNRLNYQQNTSSQHYHSSYKASNPASSSQKASSKKQFEKSKKEVSSKLEVSHQHNSQSAVNHSKSSQGESSNRASQRASAKYNIGQEEEDDVISNSSSFSQFSISASQKRDVGKISRKINN